MRWVAVLVAVSGCNQVLGIEPSILADAQQFDSPLDAPYTCPGIGTAPQFKRVFHQLTSRICLDLSVSATANRLVAQCVDEETGVAEGTIDGDDLRPALGLEPGGPVTFDQARLTPEGDELYVRVTEGATITVRIYARDATRWNAREDLALPITAADYLASVTHAPARRVFVMAGQMLHEYRSDGAGGWVDVDLPYLADNLGLLAMSTPRITGDGLRMTMSGTSALGQGTGIYYADRTALATRFGTAVRLLSLPYSINASLADDCSRLYFSSLDLSTVFYVKQP